MNHGGMNPKLVQNVPVGSLRWHYGSLDHMESYKALVLIQGTIDALHSLPSHLLFAKQPECGTSDLSRGVFTTLNSWRNNLWRTSMLVRGCHGNLILSSPSDNKMENLYKTMWLDSR